MQPKMILTYITAMAVFAAWASPLQTAAQASQKSSGPANYYVFNLGEAPGPASAAAASINNIGWLAGDAYPTATTEHAEASGRSSARPRHPRWGQQRRGRPNKNDLGEIVGIAEAADTNPLGEDWSCALANFPTITNHICFGFAWQDGVMSPLPALPGGIDSYAAGVNNRGQIVGWAENSVHESTCVPPQVLQFEAVIWGPALDHITELPPLPGDLDGAATAINDKGQVVGISGICDQAVGRFSAKHAVLWDNGTPIDIGNFDGGVAWDTPTAINNKTQIVGFANLPNTPSGAFNPVAFLWTKEHRIQELLPLGQDTNSWAWGINGQGQVVGQSFGASDARAFLYQDGKMMDSNTLIPT